MNRRPERFGDLLPGVLADLAARHHATNGAPPMPTRPLVVVDTESNGLDPTIHVAVEIAWWNLDTGTRDRFIPQHLVPAVLGNAEVKALQINRYVDRLADQPQDDGTQLARLHTELQGATLAGSNPAFDAALLAQAFQAAGLAPSPWHHRLWDLSAYAAGVLGLDELPSLAKVCDLLDVEPGDHTAEADVTATGRCIQKLQVIAAARGTGAAA